MLLMAWCVVPALLSADALSLSSGFASQGGSVTLRLSLTTSLPAGAGLQWSVVAPQTQVVSVSVIPGPAGQAANKVLQCAGSRCMLTGVNQNPLSSGIVAYVVVTLSPTASGNLAIQLYNPMEALPDGTKGTLSASDAVLSVIPGPTPIRSTTAGRQ